MADTLLVPLQLEVNTPIRRSFDPESGQVRFTHSELYNS